MQANPSLLEAWHTRRDKGSTQASFECQQPPGHSPGPKPRVSTQRHDTTGLAPTLFMRMGQDFRKS